MKFRADKTRVEIPDTNIIQLARHGTISTYSRDPTSSKYVYVNSKPYFNDQEDLEVVILVDEDLKGVLTLRNSLESSITIERDDTGMVEVYQWIKENNVNTYQYFLSF